MHRVIHMVKCTESWSNAQGHTHGQMHRVIHMVKCTGSYTWSNDADGDAVFLPMPGLFSYLGLRSTSGLVC